MKCHIITWDRNTGYDDKLDYNTLPQAKDAAVVYLKDYEEGYIVTDHTLVCVFDEKNPKGLKPYNFEVLKFRFK